MLLCRVFPPWDTQGMCLGFQYDTGSRLRLDAEKCSEIEKSHPAFYQMTQTQKTAQRRNRTTKSDIFEYFFIIRIHQVLLKGKR